MVKNLPASARDIRDPGLISGSGRPPWKSAWQPTPVFLPGEANGQRNLVRSIGSQRDAQDLKLSMHT